MLLCFKECRMCASEVLWDRRLCCFWRTHLCIWGWSQASINSHMNQNLEMLRSWHPFQTCPLPLAAHDVELNLSHCILWEILGHAMLEKNSCSFRMEDYSYEFSVLKSEICQITKWCLFRPWDTGKIWGIIYIKKLNKSVAAHVQILGWSPYLDTVILNSSAMHSVATSRDFIIDKKAIPQTKNEVFDYGY